MRALYAGFDLHGNSNYLGIMDGNGNRVFRKKLSNDLEWIREVLVAFKEELVGIAVESTYNWYWLVDGLMEEGYRVHLANPSGSRLGSGLQNCNLGKGI